MSSRSVALQQGLPSPPRSPAPPPADDSPPLYTELSPRIRITTISLFGRPVEFQGGTQVNWALADDFFHIRKNLDDTTKTGSRVIEFANPPDSFSETMKVYIFTDDTIHVCGASDMQTVIKLAGLMEQATFVPWGFTTVMMNGQLRQRLDLAPFAAQKHISLEHPALLDHLAKVIRRGSSILDPHYDPQIMRNRVNIKFRDQWQRPIGTIVITRAGYVQFLGFKNSEAMNASMVEIERVTNLTVLEGAE